MSQKKKLSKPIPVMVAIPNIGHVSVFVAKKIVEMMMSGTLSKKYNIQLDFSKLTNIDYNRNKIVDSFLKTDNKWLLMMDTDNPPLKNPLDLIELNKDVICYPTLMFKSTSTGDPTLNYNIFKKEGKMWRAMWYKDKKLQEIDAGGTGCILIKRKVLENVKKPFMSKTDKNGLRASGSDLWFCKKAKDAGFKIWTHWDYACSHIKEVDLLDVARMVLRDKHGVGGQLPKAKKVKSK